MIIASMCTIPERRDDFLNVLDAILNRQTRPVELLHVFLNGYQEIPTWLPDDDRVRYHLEPSNPGPWKRYEPCEVLSIGDLLITLDDDVLYPNDYVEAGLKAVDNHQGKVVCFSAINWDPFVSSFEYGSYRWQYMLDTLLPKESLVSLYKGQTGFLSGELPLKGIVNFTLPGFRSNDDMMVGYHLFRNQIPIVCCPKPANWIQEAPSSRRCNALFIVDSSVRKETFSRLCRELGFDPTAGALQTILQKEKRILVLSPFSPLSKEFQIAEDELFALCAKPCTGVHVLARVPGPLQSKVQEMTDKPYTLHSAETADANGRFNWVPRVRKWRYSRVERLAQQVFNQRFQLISDQLKPTEVLSLTQEGLKRETQYVYKITPR